MGAAELRVLTEQFEAADPKFTRLLQLLRVLQAANAIEFTVKKEKDTTEIWLQFHAVTVPPEPVADVKALLGIPSNADRVKVVFGTLNLRPGRGGVPNAFVDADS